MSSSSKNMDWTKLEIDALNEFFNLGLGRAAASLGQIANREIDIHAPQIEFLPAESVLDFIPEDEANDIVSVRMPFDGVIYGDSFIILTHTASTRLVKVILAQHLPEDANVTEFVADTLGETGNIILNACLAAFCETLNIELDNGLPEVRMHSKDQFIGALSAPQESTGIVAHLKFGLMDVEMEGYVLVFMEQGALATLRAKVASFLRGVMDG